MTHSAKTLVSGRDYPRAWDQFLDWFHDEAACVSYLEQLRWPQGFVCPRCDDTGEPIRASRGRFICRGCRHQCTVTAGSVFDKTRTPLRSWFAAVWYMTSQKHGVSALGLQRALGLGSYQTAYGSWAYRSLHKHGYARHKIVLAGSPDPAHVSMLAVHRVASLLKRWLLGTHQGSVQPNQLQPYLDEYTFRFNRRTSRSRGLLFYRLVEQAMLSEPMTYRDIVRENQ